MAPKMCEAWESLTEAAQSAMPEALQEWQKANTRAMVDDEGNICSVYKSKDFKSTYEITVLTTHY